MGKKVSGADCEISVEDSLSSTPLVVFDQTDSHVGEVHSSKIIDLDSFDEGRGYAADFNCWCGIDTTERTCIDEDGSVVSPSTGTAQSSFSIGTWLTVNTLTDKSVYNVQGVLNICANVSNPVIEADKIF